MVSTKLGMQSFDGVAAPPFTNGPYKWDQAITWNVTQTITDLSQGGNASDELRGVTFNATLAQATPSGSAGVRVKLTTSGAFVGGVGGAWADGFYAEVSEGTAGSSVHGTSGYISGGEFQTTMLGTWTPITAAVITLNAVDNRTAGAAFGTAFSYFFIRDYGTTYSCNTLFSFYDSVELGTAGQAKLIESSADDTSTHRIRCLVGATPLYILCTTTAPH